MLTLVDPPLPGVWKLHHVYPICSSCICFTPCSKSQPHFQENPLEFVGLMCTLTAGMPLSCEQVAVVITKPRNHSGCMTNSRKRIPSDAFGLNVVF